MSIEKVNYATGEYIWKCNLCGWTSKKWPATQAEMPPKHDCHKTKPKEDVNQAAARIVREATKNQ